MDMMKLLEINSLSYLTGNSRRITVSAVLEEGGVLNVRGPSGVGKTTLLRTLARLREPLEGTVLLKGKPWTGYPPVQWRRMVHYAAQKPVVFDGTVEENLRKPFELAAVKSDLEYNREKAYRLMEQLLLPRGMAEQDARTLSGGESSRMGLIRAVMVDPVILLLDEPLAALDNRAALAVLEFISAWLGEVPGRGVVLVSHAGETGGMPRLTTVELEPVEEGI